MPLTAWGSPNMEMLGEFGEFLLWMAYFQSSVSRDSTIASSNAFTENNVNKRKKGVSAPQTSPISLCLCIRLLQMRSIVMFLEKSCQTCRLWCFDRHSRGAASNLRKLLWLHLSLQICGKQECRQTNCKGREAEHIKITCYCSEGFWENPTVLNQYSELSKKKRNRKAQLPSHVKPYYWILQMSLQLLCRTPWNLAALAGGMTWFLFALAVLTNHLGFITVYCDYCSRVLPSCASFIKLKTTIMGLSSCSYLLPAIWGDLSWILKDPIKKMH